MAKNCGSLKWAAAWKRLGNPDLYNDAEDVWNENKLIDEVSFNALFQGFSNFFVLRPILKKKFQCDPWWVVYTLMIFKQQTSHYRHSVLGNIFVFKAERVAKHQVSLILLLSSFAKYVNSIFFRKQSIKRRKPWESKNFAYIGRKNCSFTFFCFCHILWGLSLMFPTIIAPRITNLKYLFLGRNYANAHNPRKVTTQ